MRICLDNRCLIFSMNCLRPEYVPLVSYLYWVNLFHLTVLRPILHEILSLPLSKFHSPPHPNKHTLHPPPSTHPSNPSTSTSTLPPSPNFSLAIDTKLMIYPDTSICAPVAAARGRDTARVCASGSSDARFTVLHTLRVRCPSCRQEQKWVARTLRPDRWLCKRALGVASLLLQFLLGLG